MKEITFKKLTVKENSPIETPEEWKSGTAPDESEITTDSSLCKLAPESLICTSANTDIC